MINIICTVLITDKDRLSVDGSVSLYEGSSPPKSCFKFCYVVPVYFINSLLDALEPKLNRQ